MKTDSVSKPYFTRSKGGVLMKSVTVAIRNSKQHVIGFICININLDVPASQFLSAFIAPLQDDEDTAVNFASSVEDLVAQTIEHTIEETMADRNVANNNKNRHIVVSLYEKGILISKMRSIKWLID
ncbi:YheO domain-containing protein [Actinobacillus equuli]|nr:YheO domain-containing protein [Actinobacillus equuli]